MDTNVTRPRVLGAARDSASEFPPDSTTDETDEAQVRRALGRLGKDAGDRGRQESRAGGDGTNRQIFRPAGRQRHRFVAEGEVPVVMLQPGHDQPNSAAFRRPSADPALADRLQAAEAALQHERAARQRAEVSLQAAEATIYDLRTKLGHAVLARDEAMNTLRAHEDAALRLAQPAPKADTQPAVPPDDEPSAIVRRRPGRPAGSGRKMRPANAPDSQESPDAAADSSRGAEPNPVKWWVKGWRARSQP